MSNDRRQRAIRVLARLQRALEAADAGLTIPQYRLLAILSEGGERSARVAQKLAVRKPTLTALADGLIATGCAERQSEPGDRRIVRLVLTDTGRQALARADAAYLDRLEPIFARLPDPDAVLTALIQIGDALDAALREKAATQTPAATQAPEASQTPEASL
jgi:DNA-binding MarR family transcriptional regulator